MPNLPVQEIRGELPPCLRATMFDGRYAVLYDIRDCGGDHADEPRDCIIVVAEPFGRLVRDRDHPEYLIPHGPDGWHEIPIVLITKSEAEAEAAWKRAVEWVERREPE